MSGSPDQELENIKKRFLARDSGEQKLYPRFSNFQYYSRVEREYWIGYYLSRRFSELPNLNVLEIGAGSGSNIPAFLTLGVSRHNFFANELVPDRVEQLADILPRENIHLGDARLFPATQKFDVVYISTVFTSILDKDLLKSVAEHVWTLVKPGGMVLYYDFTFNNPNNPDVKGVSVKELKALFPKAAKTESHKLTLAPPIGRRVGHLYPWLNFSFLRTHVMVGLFKD